MHYTRNTFADVLAFTSCRSKSAWIPLRSFLRRRHLRSRTRFVPLLSRVPVPLSLSRSFSLARSFTCSRVSPFLPPLCRLLKNPDLRLKVYIKELGRESRLSTLVMIGVSFSLSFLCLSSQIFLLLISGNQRKIQDVVRFARREKFLRDFPR